MIEERLSCSSHSIVLFLHSVDQCIFAQRHYLVYNLSVRYV